MADEKRPVDWLEIERDFRKGSMSIKELAGWYGLSDTAVRKRAAKEGWVREAGSHGSRREPEARTAEIEVVRTPLTAENVAPEAIVGRGRNLVLRMLDELDATTTRTGELEEIIVSAVDTGDGGKQREALQQAVSLKQRSEVLKSLATAMKTFSEATAPQGVKKQRQEAGERVAKGGGKFAAPAPPKLVVDNR